MVSGDEAVTLVAYCESPPRDTGCPARVPLDPRWRSPGGAGGTTASVALASGQAILNEERRPQLERRRKERLSVRFDALEPELVE